jgi:hypothetical protein
MKRVSLMLCAALLIFAVGIVCGLNVRNARADAATVANAPTLGWSLHIDAKKHFGDAHPDEIAHHFCKPVTGGLTECQIYDSDAGDARLVALETIVPTSTWAGFSAAEKAMWHYHRVEITKVDAKMPDLSADQAAKVVASILETYGKVYVAWDPASSSAPLGQPYVSILR